MTNLPERRAETRRRWLAVALATLVMLASYVMFIFALSIGSGDEVVFAGGVLGIALGLVPAVFAAAAFVTRHPKAFRAIVFASALWAVVTAVIGTFDLPAGLVAGFGAGGVIAFDRPPSVPWSRRAWAVSACALYTFVLQQISPAAGLLGGAPLPFAAIAVADTLTDRRAQPGDDPAD